MTKIPQFPIIGVVALLVASDALEGFSKACLLTRGFSSVVVQHLNPAESVLQIIARSTTPTEHSGGRQRSRGPPHCVPTGPSRRCGPWDFQGRCSEQSDTTSRAQTLDILLSSLAKDKRCSGFDYPFRSDCDGTLGTRASKRGVLTMARPQLSWPSHRGHSR